jgi:AcrR family transcriptional regulator
MTAKELKKADKRDQILKAASDCFARFGYEKTTLDDIGKVVGLNKASLYYYYKNKETMFCDVLYIETDFYIKELQKKLVLANSISDKILMYLGERLNYFRLAMNLHNLTLDTVKKVEPVFQEFYNKILIKEEDFLTKYFEEGIESGEFVEIDPRKMANTMLMVATSIRYRALHISFVNMAGEADYQQILEEIRFASNLIIKGIKAR